MQPSYWVCHNWKMRFGSFFTSNDQIPFTNISYIFYRIYTSIHYIIQPKTSLFSKIFFSVFSAYFSSICNPGNTVLFLWNSFFFLYWVVYIIAHLQYFLLFQYSPSIFHIIYLCSISFFVWSIWLQMLLLLWRFQFSLKTEITFLLFFLLCIYFSNVNGELLGPWPKGPLAVSCLLLCYKLEEFNFLEKYVVMFTCSVFLLFETSKINLTLKRRRQLYTANFWLSFLIFKENARVLLQSNFARWGIAM